MSPANQKVYVIRDGGDIELLIAPPEDEVIPGVKWGRHDRFCTPAYWRVMATYSGTNDSDSKFRLGRNLAEEIAACLLGGFGMNADVGMAAFRKARERGLLSRDSSEEEILETLLEPLKIRGREIHYRYPGQKAKYLSLALRRVYSEEAPEASGAVELRKWLLGFQGIGLKTASWIVRNFLRSDEVAILDLHVVRACQMMGVFDSRQNVVRHYLEMEASFLSFCRALDTSAALLDALIWEQMRTVPLRILKCT